MFQKSRYQIVENAQRTTVIKCIGFQALISPFRHEPLHPDTLTPVSVVEGPFQGFGLQVWGFTIRGSGRFWTCGVVCTHSLLRISKPRGALEVVRVKDFDFGLG